MSRRDAEFLRRLRDSFRAEAADHLQSIATGLLAMESSADDVDMAAVEIAFRHTHSLKGAARAAGFGEVEAVCQAMEDVFALCKHRRLRLEAGHFDRLHRGLELAGALIAAEEDPARRSAIDIRGAIDALARLAASDSHAPASRMHPGANARSDEVAVKDTPATAPSADHTRVSAAALDRLLYAAEDLLAVRQRGQVVATKVRNLGAMTDAWDKQWTALQGPLHAMRRESSGLPESAPLRRLVDFVDWSYGHMHKLDQHILLAGEGSARTVEQLGRQIDDLLGRSRDLRLLPFMTLAETMPMVVRDLARSQGKDVELHIHGGEVLIDKRLLDHLKAPVLHMLRNAVDHGIEAPAARLGAGKPGVARLVLSAKLINGSNIELVVEDDGRGIDASLVRDAAVRRGVIGDDAAAQLDEAKAIDLVFRSDVSTQSMPSDLSGRGLGLAIVRETVARLGGHASVDVRPNKGGTCFRLALPQAFGAFRGLFVRVGDQRFVLPTLHIAGVASLASLAIRKVQDREVAEWDGRLVALEPLSHLLGLDVRGELATNRGVVVIVEAGHHRVGVVVDEVVDEDDVLSKPLPRPLARVRNVAGATIDGAGLIVPILNAGDLVKSASSPRVAARGAPAKASDAPQRPRDVRLLLVEDSITSRLLLKGILEAAGYTVRTAVDGIEAFTALRSETFDLLVSDVEMPRLNGFDLTARVRADPVLSGLPVVLVTALANREERERGIDVGANAYITKGGFDQRTLLDAVRRLTRAQGRA